MSLLTRTHNRRKRLKKSQERKRLQEANEPYRVLQRACKSLGYSIVADGINDEAQMRILNEYVVLLDELESEMRLTYGKLTSKAELWISIERDHAINAIVQARISAISPEHKADEDNKPSWAGAND